MKNLFILTLALFLSGCSVKTIIQTPSGSEYIVSSKRNSVVEYTGPVASIKVDNRGNRSAYELILPAILSAGKDIEIQDD